MKRTSLIILISVLALLSCTPDNIIPKNKMSDIYYDFYMADRYLHDTQNSKLGDSVMVYIPIIESYGYTFEDYQATISYYLHKPEELTKIFKETEKKLKERRVWLEKAIAHSQSLSVRWELLDSLDIYGHPENTGNSYYRAMRLLFFKPDTLEISSPSIDSIILNHINSAYFLYDSLPGLYNDIRIVEYNEEKEVQDSLIKEDAPDNIIKLDKKVDIKKSVKEPETVNLLDDDDSEEERRSEKRLEQFRKTRKK